MSADIEHHAERLAAGRSDPMTKPIIRKQGDEWTVTRPGYGFSGPSTSTHESWRAAVRSLSSLGAAGPQLERAAAASRWRDVGRGPFPILEVES